MEQIDWSESGKGPADVALLAADLKAGRAGAAIARLVLNGNMITGYTQSRPGTSGPCDDDLSGLVSLCDILPVLKTPIHLDLAKCGLSVKGVIPVAKAMATAQVTSLSLSGWHSIHALTLAPQILTELSDMSCLWCREQAGR